MTNATIIAAQRGDPAAYTRLVDACRQLVCSLSLSIVRDVTASEEVAQDVFLHAWRSLPRLRNPESFLPWLRQLTRHRARHFNRTRRRFWMRHPSSGDQAEAPDPAPSPDERLQRAEDERRLAAALDELPEDSREVVLLFYREGQSVAQVAELLSLREETVRKRLERARTRLRHALLDELGPSLVRTAPTAAFTLAAAAALGAAPGTAVAAMDGAVAAPALAGKAAGLVAKATLGSALAGAGTGLGLGVVGMLFWWAGPYRRALPGAERAELRQLFARAVIHAVVFCALLALTNLLPDPVVMSVVLAIVYLVSSTSAVLLYGRPMLRTRSQQRRALAAETDPQAMRVLRRERALWVVGLTVGIVTGGATVVWVIVQLLARA